MSIEEYSLKAFVVRGHGTKQIKEKLITLNGKWNPRLKGGSGWIFSKRRLSEVQNLVYKKKPITNVAEKPLVYEKVPITNLKPVVLSNKKSLKIDITKIFDECDKKYKLSGGVNPTSKYKYISIFIIILILCIVNIIYYKFTLKPSETLCLQ